MTDPFANGYWVKADVARDLERRLAAATARAEEAWTKEVQTYYEKLEARYGRILYRLGIDPNNDPEKHVADLRAELDRLRKEREWQPIDELNKSEMQFVLVYQDGAMRASLWNPRGYWETPMVVDEPTHWMPLPAAPKQKEGV